MIPLQPISRSEHCSSELVVKPRSRRRRSHAITILIALDKWVGRFDDELHRALQSCPSRRRRT
jgi:hypothetical protein